MYNMVQVLTSGKSPVKCPGWRRSRPGRRYWERAGHRVPSAASHGKWLEESERSEEAQIGWGRKRRMKDPAAAESPWDPCTFSPLLPPSPLLLHPHLQFSACWPSRACSPAPEDHPVLFPSTHQTNTVHFPSLVAHLHHQGLCALLLPLHHYLHNYYRQDATSTSWRPLP